MWPVQECLHEHRSSQAAVVNGAGQIVNVYPAHCYECGYDFDVDMAQLPAST